MDSTKIEGMISTKEFDILKDLSEKCTGKGVIVEVGAWKGKSTIALASGKNMVYSIDDHNGIVDTINVFVKEMWTDKIGFAVISPKPYKTKNEFMKNIKKYGVEHKIIPIFKDSLNAFPIKKPIELAFIDGGHDSEHVLSDFKNIMNELIIGGIVAFHDTTFYNDPAAKNISGVFGLNVWKDIKIVDGITYATFQPKVKKVKKSTINTLLLLNRDLVSNFKKATIKFKMKHIKKIKWYDEANKKVKK